MLENYRHIHFIGIGGAGMSALAYVLVKRGFEITGSDLQVGHMAYELAEAGAMVYMGHDDCQIEGADAIVVSTAIPETNPELAAARQKNLPVLHRSDVLKELLNGKGVKGVAVAGAHGKTTTSAMIGVIAAEAGIDPTVVIGGDVASLGGNARNGESEWVIAEADESDGSFLKFTPFIPVITNIEDDHLDHYGTEENIYQAFKEYLSHMREGGTAVLCLDNVKVQRLAKETEREFVTYGLTEECIYQAKNIRHSIDGTDYELYHKGEKLTDVHLIVPGRHNVLNSLGAFAAAMLMGIAPDVIVAALAKFSGAKRRFETKGKENGIWVVDDYAHHPTEIAATLQAAKETGARRIVCVFQPHRYTRTKLLYDEFCNCFDNCDKLILTHIYSAGEQPIPGISSKLLAESVQQTTGQDVVFIDSFARVEEYLYKNCEKGDLVITMGAGDVFKIGEELVKEFQEVEK
ncbi:MAG: UDP-N-acetylmuramate--L-alanine ligase [Acidaminococcaceae bacterium]|nr:UDP-N-acetylmuramate--L-alanine ligase [Acidaminococcaceae bacterium]